MDFRYFVMPQEELPAGLAWMDFTNSTVTWTCQMAGRKDGAAAIKQGKGAVFDKIREWSNDGAIQASNPDVMSYTLDFLSSN